MIEVDATEHPALCVSHRRPDGVHLTVTVGLDDAPGELDQLHVFFCRHAHRAVHPTNLPASSPTVPKV
ncbi:hypothetical protein SSAG_03992 [Streptomyces sp. Mg1]|nr:hypothetical protein SSAG_03992 [Streptomyces sp. Mg1]